MFHKGDMGTMFEKCDIGKNGGWENGGVVCVDGGSRTAYTPFDRLKSETFVCCPSEQLSRRAPSPGRTPYTIAEHESMGIPY